MEKNAKDINALTKTYNLLLWIIPALEDFPRTQKYLLADKIEMLLISVMELLITAVYTKEKVIHLQKSNLELEKLRYLIRLAKDLKYFNLTKYEFISRSINDIGIEIGGWLKFSKNRTGNYSTPEAHETVQQPF